MIFTRKIKNAWCDLLTRQPTFRLTRPNTPNLGVRIGCRWSREHAIVRLGGVYWERSRPTCALSADEVALQNALRPPRQPVPLDPGHETAIYVVALIAAVALVFIYAMEGRT